MNVPEPVAEELAAFWTRAKTRSKLAEVPGVLAYTDVVSVEPPSFALGDGTRALADELARLVLDGTKCATSSYAPLYDHAEESYPRVGDLSILLDGNAHPVALLRNRQVEIVPFNEISESIVEAEGEGDVSQWRAKHAHIFATESAEICVEFDESAPVVVEYFDVMYRVDMDVA